MRYLRHINIFFLAAFLLAACGTQPQEETRLYVMDCGQLDYKDISFFGIRNEDTPVRSMFVPCYLIQHQGKNLLWDAGLPLSFVGQGDILDKDTGTTFRYDKSVLIQLAEIGLAPDDIDYLVLSHIHFDHAGAANAFFQSTWIVQKLEYAAAFAPQDKPLLGFMPELLTELKNAKRIELDGDYDVFGDGVVEIISAPGHTPGHQVLYLDLPETGRIILSGDLYHFRVTRDLKATPVFNFSRPQTLEAMAKIEGLLAERGAELWIEHDAARAQSQKKSPAYYR